MAERFPHRTIQAITNRHLVRIGAALVPEPLNVNDNDGPVNGQPLVLHLPSPRENKAEAKLSLTGKPIPGCSSSHNRLDAD